MHVWVVTFGITELYFCTQRVKEVQFYNFQLLKILLIMLSSIYWVFSPNADYVTYILKRIAIFMIKIPLAEYIHEHNHSHKFLTYFYFTLYVIRFKFIIHSMLLDN